MRRLFPQYDQFILGEVRQVHLFVVFTQPEDILDAAPRLSGLITALQPAGLDKVRDISDQNPFFTRPKSMMSASPAAMGLSEGLP